MQSGDEFWHGVFMAAGISQIGRLKGNYWRTRDVDRASTTSIVSAVFTGERPQIASAMRSIRFEIDYTALTGEEFHL